jgi:hypothetical protein
MYLPLLPSIIFGVVAVAFSVFYGLAAVDIFAKGQAISGAQLWHQRWFNFSGSAAGWVALYCIAAKVHRCFAAACPAEIGFGDLLASFVAFVGITGHLPYAAMGLIEGIRELAKKIPGMPG